MKTKYCLELADAELILNAAYGYALQHGFAISIAVVDETGCLLSMKRMDGASPMTARLCHEKAQCSAISKRPTKLFEDLIRNGQDGFLTVESITGMLEGGEPILYQGELIGAIGISGAKAFQDAEIAQYAIEQFLAQIQL
ncbi:MAG: GlcG/HbpS family heme-binding protein [Acinetobacter tandoii]|uniref:GlcG/HbpS family heme-binding protein n=1 Tax=Acinetobacter tandoii TaxID=202954 RepID=UPI003D6C0C50